VSYRNIAKSMSRTRLSSKGQVTIPKDVRDRHSWKPGAEPEVEDRGDAVVLRAAKAFPRKTVAQVFVCLKHEGPPL
jgi:AbrB family looped-hinge helix DNA binding protein